MQRNEATQQVMPDGSFDVDVGFGADQTIEVRFHNPDNLVHLLHLPPHDLTDGIADGYIDVNVEIPIGLLVPHPNEIDYDSAFSSRSDDSYNSYSTGSQNFDPSLHFDLSSDVESVSHSDSGSDYQVGVGENAARELSDSDNGADSSSEHSSSVHVAVRRSPRLEHQRGKLLYYNSVERRGRRFTYPVHQPSNTRPHGFDVADDLPASYYEEYTRAPY